MHMGWSSQTRIYMQSIWILVPIKKLKKNFLLEVEATNSHKIVEESLD